MKPKEPTTFPTTTEELTKLVRSIVGDALQSTADFCDAMDDDHKAQTRRQAVLEALRRASQASTRPAAKHEGSQQAQEP